MRVKKPRSHQNWTCARRKKSCAGPKLPKKALLAPYLVLWQHFSHHTKILGAKKRDHRRNRISGEKRGTQFEFLRYCLFHSTRHPTFFCFQKVSQKFLRIAERVWLLAFPPKNPMYFLKNHWRENRNTLPEEGRSQEEVSRSFRNFFLGCPCGLKKAIRKHARSF